MMNNGPLRITGGPVDLESLDSSHSLKDEELKALLATSATRKNKKKKKKVWIYTLMKGGGSHFYYIVGLL